MNELYITDLDGTLLQPNGTVSDYSYSILKEMLEKQFPFTIATARTPLSVLPILRGLPFRLPFIVLNGAVLYNPVTDKILSGAVIRRDAFLEVCRIYQHFNINGFVFCVVDAQFRIGYTTLSTENMMAYYNERQGEHADLFYSVPAMETLADQHPVFLSLHGKKHVIDPIYAAVSQIDGINVTNYQDVYETDIWYMEITSDTASKYHGVLRLREYLKPKHITCFGDNRNDIPMFQGSDYRIAVANAAADLKAMADEIIDCNAADAVTKYLHSIYQKEYIYEKADAWK
ncbi:MAG: HAD family hydrolase [Oscillospiraceae bacterium]|nr:HAD family hydrolase [Oscillospiraceae bacterium]